MKFYFVCNSMSHYKRMITEYAEVPVNKILFSFIELIRVKGIKFDSKKEYVIDSGAHTFQQPTKVIPLEDVEKYVNEYGKFIKDSCELPNLKFYAEMDIDQVYGVDNCERWLDYLSAISDKVIPVWHPEREKDIYNPKVWMKYCEQYKYVSLGGSWQDLEKKLRIDLLKWAIHKKVKVHIMGCTSLDMLTTIPGYSIDSSSWLESEEHGFIPEFDFVKMRIKRPNFKRTIYKDMPYRERTRMTLWKYLEFEKKITEFWLNNGVDWDKILCQK